eukprot:329870_1
MTFMETKSVSEEEDIFEDENQRYKEKRILFGWTQLHKWSIICITIPSPPFQRGTAQKIIYLTDYNQSHINNGKTGIFEHDIKTNQHKMITKYDDINYHPFKHSYIYYPKKDQIILVGGYGIKQKLYYSLMIFNVKNNIKQIINLPNKKGNHPMLCLLQIFFSLSRK